MPDFEPQLKGVVTKEREPGDPCDRFAREIEEDIRKRTESIERGVRAIDADIQKFNRDRDEDIEKRNRQLDEQAAIFNP